MKKPTSGKRQRSVSVDRAPSTSQSDDGPIARPRFPIVGIGASAGGLEALGLFLKSVPKSSGLAFVVVQHLDPTHEGILAELLQRDTDMPVAQITDRLRVEPDHVYVIPPNRDLAILGGVLHLLEPTSRRGMRLPIDFFLRSLAVDQLDQSIGVILSGMGSDGALGLRAIKESAGGVFVQQPESAKFDGMPRSAIESGLADVVAPAENLPVRILEYLRHISPVVPSSAEVDLEENEQSGLDKIIVVLRAQTGRDFSLYRKSTIYRRIERRMGLHQLTNAADYARYLRDNPQESELLFKELLIGVTNFFRDPVAWEQLRTEAFPELLTSRRRGTLRAWVPGCSTGEEAYSLAIVFREALEQYKPADHLALQIFATDLDKDAIEKARVGAYPLNISADVSEERLRRFFIQDEHGYRVRKEIREMVIFAPQNLVMDPPFTKLDVLTCRNLLIYLTPELQKKLLPLFHYCLTPGGLLFLGSAESVGPATSLFAALPGKNQIFRRLESTARMETTGFPSSFTRSHAPVVTALTRQPKEGASPQNLQVLAEQVILQRFAPAAVLTTDQGDILYVNGKTGKYLEPASGKANWNLLAMAREGLNQALNEAFRRALREQVSVTLKSIEIEGHGGSHFVDVSICPLEQLEGLVGTVMVVFSDLAAPAASQKRGTPNRAKSAKGQMAALERELQHAYEETRSIREEMQAAAEELRSTNEELQSTNEELQSTNEELTTSKEEMQSINEELQTVNQELQAKNSELMLTSDDMKNLLNSTDIAILFLDDSLRVRRFTTPTANIIKLIPGDAGRPITDIVSTLEYAGLADDAREVLRTLAVQEKQVPARDGRWFTVRIMPYRTQDNRIDGVVITFTDISQAKHLDAELRKAHAALEMRFSEQTVQLDAANRHISNHEINEGELP